MRKDGGKRDEEYWAEMRHDYIAKRDYLMNDLADLVAWNDPYTFYRTMWPEGFLERKGEMIDWEEPGGGRPNAIAIEITGDVRTSRTPSGKEYARPVVNRYTLTDDLDGVYDLMELSSRTLHPVYMAPVSYFGKARAASNARFLHAFTVDLDGVGLKELGNLVGQMESGYCPMATDFVLSGRGVHLYYRLEQPIPLVPSHVPALQHLKRCLIDRVWNKFTSAIPSEVGNNQRQYQGIYQAFRMPGSSTRLNGGREGQKDKNAYPCVAFDVHKRHPYSLEELSGFLPDAGTKTQLSKLQEFAMLWETGGRTPLSVAAEKWPEWYERRIVRGEPAAGWSRPVNRAAYDSWKQRMTGEPSVGHRYNAIVTLAAYGAKCGLSYEEVEADALALVDPYDSLARTEEERFTTAEALSALDAYHDPRAVTYTNRYMCRIAGVEPAIPKRRNGRKQEVHLARARAVQQIDDPDGTWRNKAGAPTKRDQILAYAAEHPEANHSQIARALGVSRPTVIKWMRERDEREG